jgi:dTDP-4-dehydrorhamnose reductase
MLGTELSGLLTRKGVAFTGTDRELDITESAALESFIEARKAGDSGSVDRPPVEWIINCAAYTAVDRAEDDEETCRRLNTRGAANIAALAKKNNARLIHISTDYVFDGKGIAVKGPGDSEALRPYREEDPVNPTGVYGLTKRDGELEVMKHSPRSYIVRTAWLYGQYGGNFVHTMLRLMNERDSVSVVDDQRGSPTWAGDLSEALLGIVTAVEEGRSIPYGVYHYSNEGNITWFDFAVEIYCHGRRLGLIKKDCALKPCSSAGYPAKVKRPAYSVLDKTKFRAALGMDIPSWDESLIKFLEQKARDEGLVKQKPKSDVRWKQRFENFTKSLDQLTVVVNRYHSRLFTDLERTAGLKYFEMTFELAWKVMKDFLAESGITGVIGSRDAIRQAFNAGIIDKGEIWLQMVDSRNELVHSYDEKIAHEILLVVVNNYHSLLLNFASKMNRVV